MLHKHIAKHAKRAHAHIQSHGHKWLWLLSGVFFFILIYPYFSNAQVPDTCLNGATNHPICDVCAEGFELEGNQCTQITPDPVDLCQNINGIQETIPEGQELNDDNECVAIQCDNNATNYPVCDVCAEGFELDDADACVEIEPEVCENDATNHPACDVCVAGFELNDEDVCVEIEIETEEIVLAPITGTITYNPTTNTTGTVTATLTGFSTTGVTITNNSGSNTKVFTQTGSFTFTFENEQGATGSATATVTWIVPEVVVQPCTLQITTPASGAIVGGAFPIGWTNAGGCVGSTPVTIQLRDHNGQRISLGTGTLGQTGINFLSTGLVSTGFYTVTGTYLSGTARQEISGGVVVASGIYTQNTPYAAYTGAYSGAYTNFATGYKIRLINTNTQDTLVTQAGTFTIDNQKPTLTGLTGSFAPLFSGSVGKVGIMTASFTANKQLTGGTTFTILGTNVTPTSVVQNGNVYSYTIPLSTVAANGALNFTAHVTDLAGNTGSLYGTSSIIFNNQLPTINGFTMTGGNSGSVTLSWTTNVSTKHNISYYKSGTTTTTAFTGTVYATAHNYTMTNIQNNNQYPFSLIVSDNLGNTKGLSGTLNASTTGALSINMNNSNDIIQLSGQVETNLYLQILQNEINKFQTCKSAIIFTNQTIPVGTKSVTIKIPTISNNGVKQTMLTFLLLFTNKVQEKTALSQTELNIVAEAVNNFLVVIKLVDDDDNYCEQKMSTYYLSQFEQLMSSMNFF